MDMTIVYIEIILAIAACIFFYLLEKKKKKSNIAKDEATDMKELLLGILAKNQCQYVEAEAPEGFHSYEFSFQDGYFRVRFKDGSSILDVMFLNFLTMPIEQIDIARSLCNDMNSSLLLPHVFYTCDTKKNDVHIHLSTRTFFPDVASAENFLVEEVLKMDFQVRSYVCSEYDKMVKKDVEDQERQKFRGERERYLLSEQEMHDEDVEDLRAPYNGKVTLGQILDMTFDVTRENVKRLTVVSNDQLVTFSGVDDIWNFNVASVIVIPISDTEYKILATNATLIIAMSTPSNADEEKDILVELHAETKTKGAVYIRTSVTMPPEGVVPNGAANKEIDLHDEFLIAFDMSSAEKKRQEFEYLYQEAHDKMIAGDIDGMTDNERLLLMSNDRFSNFNVYWGTKMYEAGRYLEALSYLEKAYITLQADFLEMKNSEKDAFYELCYMIGFCYVDLRKYTKAYYYLDAIFNLNRVRYTEEYVNCLTNAKDFRALGIINNLINVIDNLKDNPDEEEEEDGEENISAKDTPELKHFRDFLCRRRAYAYIDLGMLDEAEKEFKAMLADPDNKDYALSELAYIERLRKEES